MTFNLAALRDLPASARWTVLLAVVALAAGLLMLDAAITGIELHPLIFALLIVATAFGGMRFGVTFAVVSAFAFTTIEWHRGGRPYDPTLLFNSLIAALASSCIPVLVVFLQQRARRATKLEAQLRQNELERTTVAATEAARIALARSEENYRAMGESVPFGVWQTDADGKLVYVSESYRRVTGLSLEELREGRWRSLVAEADARRYDDAWAARDASSNGFFEGEYRLRGVDGRSYTILSRGVRLRPDDGSPGGWAGVNLDITDRKRATDAVALLEEVGRQLMLSLDPTAILERVAVVCASRFAEWVIIDVVAEDGSLQTAAMAHADPAWAETAAALRQYPVNGDAEFGSGAVARSGRSELFAQVPVDLLREWAVDDRHFAQLSDLGLHSGLIVPLIARQRVIGTLSLYSTHDGRRYDEEDRGVAEVLGVRTALAYQNALHYAREVRVADTLQQASLPQELPRLPGLRIDATYIPGASESEIGGDWYDAFLLPDGAVGITIGDVAGKGLRAAVAMGVVRQALRYAALDGLAPSVALARVNRHLCYERTGMVTAISARFDPASNTLVYASAGHPAALVGAADGSVRRLATQGVPLGLFAESTYVELHERLERGELLVLYTDGLIEQRRNITEGERELEAAVGHESANQSASPAASIQRRVIEGRPKDDVAVLTIALAAERAEQLDLEMPAVAASARVLRQTLRRLAIDSGLDDDRTFSLLVAAGEAISNAIEHAYGLKDGTVRLQAHVRDGLLEVCIKDSGVWRASRSEGRGRGLPIMRQIVDQADVRADENGTTVRLAMHVQPARRAV